MNVDPAFIKWLKLLIIVNHHTLRASLCCACQRFNLQAIFTKMDIRVVVSFSNTFVTLFLPTALLGLRAKVLLWQPDVPYEYFGTAGLWVAIVSRLIIVSFASDKRYCKGREMLQQVRRNKVILS